MTSTTDPVRYLPPQLSGEIARILGPAILATSDGPQLLFRLERAFEASWHDGYGNGHGRGTTTGWEVGYRQGCQTGDQLLADLRDVLEVAPTTPVPDVLAHVRKAADALRAREMEQAFTAAPEPLPAEEPARG